MSAWYRINALVTAKIYLEAIHANVRREPPATHTLEMAVSNQIQVTVLRPATAS